MSDKTLMTEEQVLKELNIPDFRHLSKDKVMTFASMLSNMAPDVAEKALEQFPEFGKMALEAMEDNKSVLMKSLDANNESTKGCFEAYDTIIDTLKSCIDKEDLTFEEKKYYLEKMIEVAKFKDAKDSENKEFIGKVIGAGVATVLCIIGVGATALSGGKIEIPLLKSKK